MLVQIRRSRHSPWLVQLPESKLAGRSGDEPLSVSAKPLEAVSKRHVHSEISLQSDTTSVSDYLSNRLRTLDIAALRDNVLSKLFQSAVHVI